MNGEEIASPVKQFKILKNQVQNLENFVST